MSDQYTCTLDATTQEKAKEELNEDPKNRQGAIDTFRQWIVQQKHFKCPTDDVFLLAFLRARKFSQLEARKQLENYLKRRQKLSSWFTELDSADDPTMKALGTGPLLLLPGRDPEGRRVFMIRIGKIDITEKLFKKKDLFRTFATLLDYLYFTDEVTQVEGTVTVIDFSKMTIGHQTKISLEERKNFIGTWQKNYPARIKGIHMYNMGPFVEFVLMVVRMAMSEKVQKRLTLHTHGLESLYKVVPMSMLPAEYLPDEYDGPNAGTEAQVIEYTMTELGRPEVRDRVKFLSSKEFYIDLKEKDTGVPEASFRKLNVD